MSVLISGYIPLPLMRKMLMPILAFSEDQPQLINHVVRPFPIDGEGVTEYKSAVPFYQTSTAGAFADGTYYMASSRTSGSTEVADALYKLDLSSGSYEKVRALTGYSAFVNDMTYDLSTNTMYAHIKVDDNSSALMKIDTYEGDPQSGHA